MLQENIKRDKKSLCKELWEKSTDSKTTGRHFVILRCVIIWMLFGLLVFCCSNKASTDLFIDLLQLYRLGELGDFSFSGKFHQSCFYLVFLFLFVYTIKTSLYILWNVKKVICMHSLFYKHQKKCIFVCWKTFTWSEESLCFVIHCKKLYFFYISPFFCFLSF